MRRPLFRDLLLLLLAALALSACHGRDDLSQPGGSSPEAAVQGSVELLKRGDFNGLWKHALPPADYATLRADWNRHPQNPPWITAADRARFSAAMQQLTAPDAETTLFAKLQPKLVKVEQQYKDQLPVLISIGAAFVKNGIRRNPRLSDAQKTQLTSVLDVLTPWAQQAPWFDQARAKQAIGILVVTARQLALKNSPQRHTMDFDTAMAKYAQALAGARQLLTVYGVSMDDTLNSVQLTQLSSAHGHAVVKVDYTLLGKPLSAESNLLEQGGRWYSQDMLDIAQQAHAQWNQPAAPAAATTAPAAAGSVATHD